MRRLATVAVFALLVLAATTSAFAYYGVQLSGGSNGAAGATSLQQGSTPNASVSTSRTLTVTWGQSVLTNGTAVPGYVVHRYEGDSPYAQQTVGPGCSGVITTLTCTESAVPPGNWRYTVTPVAGTNWTGTESPQSGAVTVGAAALTLGSANVGGPLPQTVNGTLSGFSPGEGITYRLDDPTAGQVLSASPTVADASGNATVSVTIPAGVADGSHTVYAVGNSSPYPSQASAALVVDTVAPTSQATGADSLWHASAVQVTLSATDATSGVATIKYTVDGGAVQTISGASGQVTITAPTNHSNDGVHTISFYATDRAGNVESPAHVATVKIDTVAPTTTLGTTPSTPDGSNSWFKRTSVSFTLSANDPAPASGVAHTYYTVDGGAAQLYSTAVTIGTPGDHTVAYWSDDNAGNTEATNTAHIKLDAVAPATTITVSPTTPNGANGWYTSAPHFTLSASDATSGVGSSFYTIDGGATQTYSGSVTVSNDGSHTIQYWSTDNAGNNESANTVALKVDTTPPTTSDNTGTIGAAWFDVTKTVTLSPSDSASGVAGTYYTSDGSTPTTSSSSGTSVALSSDGVYTVKYFSTDNAGNNESVKTAAT